MDLRVLLDTNAYSALLRNDERVADCIRRSETVYFSIVVVAELLSGFRNGRREAHNRDRLDAFLADSAVQELPITRETAEHYSAIWSELRARGRPIPSNDVWIAAHVRQTGTELVTFDRHFEEVSGLMLRLLE